MGDPNPQVINQRRSELRSTNKETRRRAANLLAMMNSEEADSLLIYLLTDHGQDLLARGIAAEALGRHKSVAAVRALVNALTAPGTLPTKAVKALGQIGNKNIAIEIIAIREARYSDKDFKNACDLALKQLNVTVEHLALQEV
jgi:HEAT repeat protein